MKSKVILNNNKMDDYDKLLSIYDWTQYKREIKLKSILEDNKIEFSIEPETPMYINIESGNQTYDILLKNFCAVVKRIVFIIKKNEIIELSIESEPLGNDSGKVISSLIDSGVNLEIHQEVNDSNDVLSFFFRLPEEAA